MHKVVSNGNREIPVLGFETQFTLKLLNKGQQKLKSLFSHFLSSLRMKTIKYRFSSLEIFFRNYLDACFTIESTRSLKRTRYPGCSESFKFIGIIYYSGF